MQLVNADQPYWLLGITEMTRTFGLELLESVLTNFTSVFFRVSFNTFSLILIAQLELKILSLLCSTQNSAFS